VAEAPARKIATKRITLTDVVVCAGMLAMAAGTYFLLRQLTDWSPYAAAMAAVAVGSFAFVGLALVWIMLRLRFPIRNPQAIQARHAFMEQAEADRKELGLDKETKAFAERDVEEFTRKLRELELSPQYIKAGESERDRMMKEVADRHVKEGEAKVHEEAARATERIEALRQYRELDQRARRGESLSLEEKERMKRLKATAYAGKLR
jgi:hypothetical protein